jgi:hypothetical protein
MMKRGLVFGLCAVALLLSYAAAGGAVYFNGAQDESGNTLPLPYGAGWLIEMSRDGGMRPAKQSVRVNSLGEISVHAEHYAAGGVAVVDCSLKTKLAPEDFLKLKEAVRALKPADWRDGYEDKKHPICCDQPTTHLTLRRRESRDSTRTVSTSWYPGNSELRPADLTELAAVVEELWNKASAQCEAGAAS